MDQAILLSEPEFPPLYGGDDSSTYIIPILQMRTLRRREINM